MLLTLPSPVTVPGRSQERLGSARAGWNRHLLSASRAERGKLPVVPAAESARPESAPLQAVPEARHRQTFDGFCCARGVDRFPPSFPELHFRPVTVSTAQERASEQRVTRALAEWGNDRDARWLEYNADLAAGKIIVPTRTERLLATAAGSGSAAEAARRLLNKQNNQ